MPARIPRAAGSAFTRQTHPLTAVREVASKPGRLHTVMFKFLNEFCVINDVETFTEIQKNQKGKFRDGP